MSHVQGLRSLLLSAKVSVRKVYIDFAIYTYLTYVQCKLKHTWKMKRLNKFI